MQASATCMSVEQCWEFTKTRPDCDAVVENIRRLYERKGNCEICVKIPSFDVEKRTGIVITEGVYGNAVGEVQTCPYIFYSMAVNSDGTVSLCFLDWARKLDIGDVRTESLKEIWNGEPMHGHRVAHLKGCRKDDPTCAACGQLSHCLPDNIDPYAAILLERIAGGKVGKAA